MNKHKKLNEVLLAEEIHLKKLHELINESLKEEELLASRLLELETIQDESIGQKMADKVANFGGSWAFIITFLFLMTIWIIANQYLLKDKSFDPYPFILLNLLLSCLAAMQAPIIMMSQNRVEEKDRSRSRSDFMINIKSEMELRNLHQKIDLLMAEQMKTLFELQHKQMELLLRLEKKLNQ